VGCSPGGSSCANTWRPAPRPRSSAPTTASCAARSRSSDLLERLEGNPDDRARFEREAWVLAALDHPGLPDVLDSGTADGRPYTVMELCAGRPAQRYCEEDNRLRLAEVLQVGIQVAEALRSVHAIGVIHRDLSAQNVLIEAGREPRVKVIDFTGCLLTDRFFNLRDEPRPADPLTILRDRPLHTLSFAAPEVRADRCWSERSDVYALGVLLYRLLSGKVPFAPQARDQYIPLPAGLHGRSVEDVLMAMLNPNPAERLADMAMVAERLREVIEMEAERNPAPPRPPLALVPSEPDHETAVEASPGEAVAGPSGEPIAVDPVAIVADVQAPVSEADAEPAVGLVAAAAPTPAGLHRQRLRVAACIARWWVAGWRSPCSAACGWPARPRFR
jgi:serine/threonine protein kinase